MPSSLSMGFSPYMKPMLRRANPEREAADWRAVCGRTACTVRRAGRTSVLPDPYHWPVPVIGVNEYHTYRKTALRRKANDIRLTRL